MTTRKANPAASRLHRLMRRNVAAMTAVVILLVVQALLASAACAANSSREFGGVGIDGVPQPDGRIVVRQLVAGGPAHLAGIRIGDTLTHIDGKPTRGSDFTDIIEHRLRGRSGTQVLITILRPGETNPRHFKLTRRQLVIGPASSKPK